MGLTLCQVVPRWVVNPRSLSLGVANLSRSRLCGRWVAWRETRVRVR